MANEHAALRHEADASVLRYWKQVEDLLPPECERHGTVVDGMRIVHVKEERGYPWLVDVGEEIPDRRHVVCFGIVARSVYDDALRGILGLRPEERPAGEGRYVVLGRFHVDHEGVADPETVEIASFACNVAALAAGAAQGPAAHGAVRDHLKDRLVAAVEAYGVRKRPVDASFVRRLTTIAWDACGWTPPAHAAPLAVVYCRNRIWKPVRDPKTGETVVDPATGLAAVREIRPSWDLPPLSGWFSDDLLRESSAAEAGSTSPLVAAYLADPDPSSRTDCSDPSAVLRSLGPDRTPDARWPSAFPLTTLQQAAVNEIVSGGHEGRLFSVNGPPGTGKTTLVMDVVAAVVAQRAKVLAGFDHPEEAFRRASGRGGHALDDALKPFLMVVASSNNGAVENIVRELPVASRIAPAFAEGWVSAFADTAGILLDKDHEAGSGAAWGLVSAALGRKSNRSRLKNVLAHRIAHEDGSEDDAEGGEDSADVAAHIAGGASGGWTKVLRNASPHNFYRIVLGADAGWVPWNDARRRWLDAMRDVESAKEALRRAAEGGRVPAGFVSALDHLGATEAVRQQTTPLSSFDLEAARARLFVESVRLHEAFLFGAGELAARNVALAMELLTNPKELEGGVGNTLALDLLATLAIAVPVMSTTFASFTSCFASVPTGGMALLVVDEAGQAVPQHAVGALARSARAVVVGDPLQLEPVCPIAPDVDEKLSSVHGVDRRFLCSKSSMQTLADGINPIGRTIRSLDGRETWVGSPLVVHRRCVEPMFSISNRIAYGGTMVLGDGMAEREVAATLDRPLVGPSAWIDAKRARGTPPSTDQNYFRAEGEIVEILLRNLGMFGADGLPECFVLTPFKGVANGLWKHLDATCAGWAPGIDRQDVRVWLKRSLGTIHTFQGRECETVVAVLGGSSKRAVGWAASTPNLVNVATTRARRRLYVVGEWKSWSKHPLVAGSMAVPGWRRTPEEMLGSLWRTHLSPPTAAPRQTRPPSARRSA